MRLVKLYLISLITLISFNVHAQCYDTAAVTFFTATGITDTAQKNSINHLVLDLKNYGLWTKMVAIYPFVGDNAAKRTYNLKDPRNLDAAYRLTFYGSFTHSATGSLPDGTSGYADTHLTPNSTALSQNSTSLSFYSRTNNTQGGADIGTEYGNYNYIEIRQGDNSVFGLNSANFGITGGLTTDGRGLFTLSRTSSAQTVLYRNGTSIATSTETSVSPSSVNILLFAGNRGNTIHYSNRECAFASIGDGLLDSSATRLSQIVNAYLYNLANGGGGAPAGCGGGGAPSGTDTTWIKSGNNIYFNNGNVGIGTTNPTTKLSVAGTIKAYKLTVTTAWSDYVFDKNYKLPTLTEIEKYVKKHQHLSEIPSAKEVEKNGVDVGKNQSLLLKKIEEMTLLMIEQNKKLEKQNSKIQQLEKQVKNIK